MGYDHIDVKTPTEKRDYVTNTLGANAVSVAEFAFSLMICAAWTILWLNSRLRAGVRVWEAESKCAKSEKDAYTHH